MIVARYPDEIDADGTVSCARLSLKQPVRFCRDILTGKNMRTETTFQCRRDCPLKKDILGRQSGKKIERKSWSWGGNRRFRCA